MSMIRCAARTASLLRSMRLHLRELCTVGDSSSAAGASATRDAKVFTNLESKEQVVFDSGGPLNLAPSSETKALAKDQIGMSRVREEIVSDSSSLARSLDFEPTEVYLVYMRKEDIEGTETGYDIYRSIVKAVLGDKGWERAVMHYYEGSLSGFAIRLTEHQKNIISKFKGVVWVFKDLNLPLHDPWMLSLVVKDMFSGSRGEPMPHPDPFLLAELNATKRYLVYMTEKIENEDIAIQTYKSIFTRVLGKDGWDFVYGFYPMLLGFTAFAVGMTEKQKDIMSELKEVSHIFECRSDYQLLHGGSKEFEVDLEQLKVAKKLEMLALAITEDAATTISNDHFGS